MKLVRRITSFLMDNELLQQEPNLDKKVDFGEITPTMCDLVTALLSNQIPPPSFLVDLSRLTQESYGLSFFLPHKVSAVFSIPATTQRITIGNFPYGDGKYGGNIIQLEKTIGPEMDNGGIVELLQKGLEPTSAILRMLDPSYQQHTESVGHCMSMAEPYLGIERSILGMAGHFHDIGKLLISYPLLNNPGALSKAEREEMENHSLLGAMYWFAKLDQKKDEIPPLVYNAVMLGILLHHEQPNGKGYPLGLKSGEIPLFVEVMSIFDVLNALTTKRVYKSAMRYGRALMEIMQMADNGSLSNNGLRVAYATFNGPFWKKAA